MQACANLSLHTLRTGALPHQFPRKRRALRTGAEPLRFLITCLCVVDQNPVFSRVRFLYNIVGEMLLYNNAVCCYGEGGWAKREAVSNNLESKWIRIVVATASYPLQYSTGASMTRPSLPVLAILSCVLYCCPRPPIQATRRGRSCASANVSAGATG